MKVKCPRCGVKEESVDGKCSVCDLPLSEVEPSLLEKFRSLSSQERGVIIFLLIIFAVWIFLYVPRKEATQNYKSTETKEPEPTRYSNPIEGFLGVEWGDSMEIAAQKLASNGYEIQNIDNPSKTINLKPIVLAGYTTSYSEVGKLLFYSKGFYSGYVFFTPSSSKIETTKEALISIITQKYGPPTPIINSNFVIWKSKDGCEIILIKTSLILLRYDNKKVMDEDAAIIAAEEKEYKLLLEKRENELKEEERNREIEKNKALSNQF